MAFKLYPEAAEWLHEQSASDEYDEQFDYDDWLWRMLSLHGDKLPAELVNTAAKRALNAYEARFLAAWVKEPNRTQWLKDGSTEKGQHRTLRNTSMQMDFEYLTQVEKLSKSDAYEQLSRKYAVAYENVKRIVRQV